MLKEQVLYSLNGSNPFSPMSTPGIVLIILKIHKLNVTCNKIAYTSLNCALFFFFFWLLFKTYAQL